MSGVALRHEKAVLLAVLVFQFTVGAEDCPSTGSPILTDTSLEAAYAECTSVAGDVVLGLADCSSQCTLTSLASLAGLHIIEGSLVIQCCSDLEEIRGLNALTAIAGTLRIYYNEQMHTIDGFEALASVGNLEISQNGNLTKIGGFSSVVSIGGYLQINHNRKLVDLDGLSSLSEISGTTLVAGHALNVLYNPALLDLRWLRNLSRIEFGTVHIEGNLQLCYAGYPQWAVGEYRSRPPSGDRGIDWRTILGAGVPKWQYSWGGEGSGYPTLVIENNAAYDDCDGASCHTSCVEGAGCLGPLNPDLCGTCLEGSCEIGATPTSASCDPTSIPYWPPTEMPYSLVFGVFFGFVGLLLLCLVLFGAWVMCRICRRLRAGKKGSFDINEGLEMGERGGEFGGNLSSSSIIAQAPVMSRTKRERGGNVVLKSSSYRPAAASVTPHTPPTSTTVTPHTPPTSTTVTSHTPPTSTTADTISDTTTNSPSTTAPSLVAGGDTLQEATRGSEQQVLLHSIAEEVEEGREGEEGEREKGEGQQTPVRRLYKQDTLTRLRKSESGHIQMNFPRSQIKLKKEIGKGEFGMVFFAEARRLVSGEKKTPVIVKQLKENSSKQEQETFLRPVEAMSLLQHSNVLSLMGACVDGEPIMILMEYCSHGNLKTYLVRKRQESAVFQESGRLVTIACDMAAGLTYLHSNNIAHNDFAVRNCLVSGNEVVKLGDYGLTKHTFKEDYYSRGGHQKVWPVRWMAPEQMIVKRNVLDSQPASTTGNVWSFGISLWEVSTFAQWPYFDLSDEEVIDTVQSSWQCTLENPFQPSDTLAPLYDIMQLCWKPADERPTMGDIVSRLEKILDDVTRDTPSSGRRKIKHTASHSPKTTPTTPHPKPVSDVTPPPTRSAGVPTKKHSRTNYKPRRPAPMVPEEGSLKRGTKLRSPDPIDAHHQHPVEVEESSNARAEKKDLLEGRLIEHEVSGVGMVKVNPLFEEMEQQLERDNGAVIAGVPQGGGRVWEEGDTEEGVLLVNRLAEKGEEGEEMERGREGEGGGKGSGETEGSVEAKEEDEWAKDFILEPPEDFSQLSMDQDVEETNFFSPANTTSHKLHKPTESQFTSSAAAFEPEYPSKEPSLEEQQRTDSFTAQQSHSHTTTHSNGAAKRRRKHRKTGSRSGNTSRKTRGDLVGQLPPPTRHSWGESPGETTSSLAAGAERSEGTTGWDEPHFQDDLDSRYRPPTSRISALLKRAPSWGRSGTTGDDEMPDVVLDDEVSKLIW